MKIPALLAALVLSGGLGIAPTAPAAQAAQAAPTLPPRAGAPTQNRTWEPVHAFALDPVSHDTYGLSYPITYMLTIPPGAADLRAFKYVEQWEPLPTRLSTEVFSGVEAARFDYQAGQAIVSVSFPAESDVISIALFDRFNRPVSTAFDSVARYYDDSKAVVVLTGDDWQEHDNAAFAAACSACRSRNLWFTPGICTRGMAETGWGPPDWGLIQQEVDSGHVEPASHSRYHLFPPYDYPQWGIQSSYEDEIGGSRDDILQNLVMPPLNRRGDTEHLYCWIRPFARIDPTACRMLGEFGYLADRQGPYSRWFATWNGTCGVYPVAVTSWIDTMTVAAPMNSIFDWIVQEGSIYYMLCHPRAVDWESGPVIEHLDHVANRPDLWYVGLGHLYVYHYMKEMNLIAHVIPTSVEGRPDARRPAAPRLQVAEPNPFSDRTAIRFDLPSSGPVQLRIYDIRGRLVRRLLAETRESGSYAIPWNGRDDGGAPAASGVYVARLEAGGAILARRFVKVR